MKHFLFLTLSICALSLNAQITITNADMPQSGDSLRYSIATVDTSILLNYQNTGANQTWNFSGLNALRQGASVYISSAQSPYSSSVSNRIAEKVFDTLSLGGVELLDVYDFYNSSASEFALDYRGASIPTGIIFFPVIRFSPAYTDKDEIYQFPLNYQDRDSSTFLFAFNNNAPLTPPAYYGSQGYRINDVDAWGSLTTPFGTFNCIRVVTDVVSYDTVSFGGNNFGINSHTREYKWLTNQFEIPALTINGQVINGTFVPTTVEYRDSVRNVPNQFAPIALFTADSTVTGKNLPLGFNNLSVSLFPANYRWSISPNTFTFNNGTSATTDSIVVSFQDTGFYSVQLIASNSRGKDTLNIVDYIYVDQNITSVSEVAYRNNSNFYLFPNPSNTQSTVLFKNQHNQLIKEIEIFDIVGKQISTSEINSNSNLLELLSPKKTGVYFVNIISADKAYLQKLVVR